MTKFLLSCALVIVSSLSTSAMGNYFQDALGLANVDQLVAKLAAGDISLKRADREIGKLPLPQKQISSLAEFMAAEDSNTIYIINGDINLGGKTVKIPGNCILYVRDGMLSNGKVAGDNTYVLASDHVIFAPGETKYRGYKKKSEYLYVVSRKGAVELTGTWANRVVAPRWTGLESDNPDKCQSLALNNLVRLYRKDVQVVVPEGHYYIYDWIRLGGRKVDFSGSELLSIDFDKVEDVSIKLPKDVVESPLKSRYGLLDINGTGSVIKNVTIDGRASSRDEEPALGRECLVTIVSNSTGVLQNVLLKDAVDCAISTGAIGKYVFDNVKVDKCGEHGIYLHGYRDTLRFKNCIFNNCGQSETLYKIRGISGCVRCNTPDSISFSEMARLRMYFEDCTFSVDGKYKAATLYSGIPHAEFSRCRWIGSVAGYVFNIPEYNEETGRMCEYSFFDCDNPCGNHNAVNVKRTLVRCTNVRNVFEDTFLVEDCDIVTMQYTLTNKLKGKFASELKTPILLKGCTFRTKESKPSGRVTISHSRPMVFEDCRFSLAGGGLLSVEGANVTFIRCSGLSDYKAALNGKGKKNAIKIVKN